MRTVATFTVILSFAILSGCDKSTPPATTPPPPTVLPPTPMAPAATPATPATPPAPNTDPQAAAGSADAAAEIAAAINPIASNQPAPTTETVVADVGVGKKGRSLDEYEGAVVTPAKSLFAVRERTVFEILIPKNLELFKATEGRLPKSHEEFMQRIISEGMIQLPELPEGHKYRWDPAMGELMVDRPKKPAPAASQP